MAQPFKFDPFYNFPPFYTRQTNLNTLHEQLKKWSSQILNYCKHYRIFKIHLSSVIADSSSAGRSSAASPEPNVEELFYNRRLNRRLSLDFIREILDFMRKDGRAEYVGKDVPGDICWIYWRTPEEWAAVVEAWIDETAQKGTVLTLYELTEGERARGTGKFVLRKSNCMTQAG